MHIQEHTQMCAVVNDDSLAQDFLEAVLGCHSTIVLAHYTKGHGRSQRLSGHF